MCSSDLDGQYTDEDPEPIGENLTSIGTSDGQVLLFNIHIAKDDNANPITFPEHQNEIPQDEIAQKLFRMSSILTDSMIDLANKKDKQCRPGARGYVFNADFTSFIDFLDIGTRPAM